MRKTGLQVETLVVVFAASISDSVVKGVGMEMMFLSAFPDKPRDPVLI